MATGGEGFEDSAYRPINGVAIAAAVTSLFGFVALLGPAFLIVPMFTFALACYALYSVSRRQGVQSGRGAALFGLAVSVFFATAGPTRDIVYVEKLRAEGKTVADRWLEMLRQGKVKAAMQVRRDPGDRADSLEATDLGTYYATNVEAEAADERIISEDPFKTILELGDQVQFKFLKSLGVASAKYNEQAEFEYEMRFERDGEEVVWYVHPIAKRWLRVEPDGVAGSWQIAPSFNYTLRPKEPDAF